MNILKKTHLDVFILALTVLPSWEEEGNTRVSFIERRTGKDRRMSKNNKSKNGLILNNFLGANGKDRRKGKDRRSVTNQKVESERRKLADSIIEYLEDELKR